MGSAPSASVNWSNKSTTPARLPWGWSKTMPVKHLAQCLAHKTCSANDSYFYQEVLPTEAVIQKRIGQRPYILETFLIYLCILSKSVWQQTKHFWEVGRTGDIIPFDQPGDDRRPESSGNGFRIRFNRHWEQELLEQEPHESSPWKSTVFSIWLMSSVLFIYGPASSWELV